MTDLATGTFWNGEPANCAPGSGVVSSDLPAVGPWPARAKGQRIRVVRVFYAGDHFDLDDEDGRAWRKVTNGHGSPRFGHRNVTLETCSLEPDSWEPLIREYAKQQGIDVDADGY